MDPPLRAGLASESVGESHPQRNAPIPRVPINWSLPPVPTPSSSSSHRNTGAQRRAGLPGGWNGETISSPGNGQDSLAISYTHPTIPIFPSDVSDLLVQRALLRESIRNVQSQARRLAQDPQALRVEQGVVFVASMTARGRLLARSWTNPEIWIQDEKKQIRMQIEATSTSKLAPKMNETELIQKLVCHEYGWPQYHILMLRRSSNSYNMTAMSRQPEHLQRKFMKRRRP